jgi:hypothetical protein
MMCGLASGVGATSDAPPVPLATKCPGRCQQTITCLSIYESPCCLQVGQGPSATFKCECKTAADCQAAGGAL